MPLTDEGIIRRVRRQMPTSRTPNAPVFSPVITADAQASSPASQQSTPITASPPAASNIAISPVTLITVIASVATVIAILLVMIVVLLIRRSRRRKRRQAVMIDNEDGTDPASPVAMMARHVDGTNVGGPPAQLLDDDNIFRQRGFIPLDIAMYRQGSNGTATGFRRDATNEMPNYHLQALNIASSRSGSDNAMELQTCLVFLQEIPCNPIPSARGFGTVVLFPFLYLPLLKHQEAEGF
ncbi:hypothetical protein BC829DRAFT_415009 [Chytridium lagenaria]|nr:hypothetical protein BC829DRAFT_415009 [Chytridium lagenaria]